MRWFLATAFFIASLPSLADEAPTPSIPSPSSPPSPASSEKFLFVPTGVERSINFMAVLFPDCSIVGPVVARLQNKPQHGEAIFKEESSFSTFPVGNLREKCNPTKVLGLLTNYKSEEGFVGEDHFDVLYLYPTSTAGIVKYTISVR